MTLSISGRLKSVALLFAAWLLIICIACIGADDEVDRQRKLPCDAWHDSQEHAGTAHLFSG